MSMKALANRSRKAVISTPPLKRDPRMARKYAPEVSSLRAALNRAVKQKPLERQAQIIAQGVVSKKVAANPDMSRKDREKIERMAIETARARLGVDRQGTRIRPTPREWEAIQRGAVSNAMMEEIVANADSDHIKKLAMPREKTRVTTAQQSRIMTLRSRGATHAEIAEALGLSVSQVKSVIYNDE